MKLYSINPHDQSVVGELPVSSTVEIEKAVNNARNSQLFWKDTKIEQRCEYINIFKELLNKNKKQLATLITQEMGKPILQSIGEIESELNFIQYYIDNGPKFLADREIIKIDKESYKITYEPYGVCACICPWNFPLSMVTSGVIPALIAGNTVVIKPSEYTSLSQKMVIDLLKSSGIPKGVVNLVIGSSDVGVKLIDLPIDMVWFTGSTKAGSSIYDKCSKRFVKPLLEMGGSSAGIIISDANIQNAVENIYWARFLNCGQVCTAVKRLFVDKAIFDDFVTKLTERTKMAKVNNPIDKNCDIGPLINKNQLEKVEIHLKDAIQKGAKVLVGGKRPSKSELANGNYFEPTILTDVTLEMDIMKEETFGPILPIMSFDSIDEAINLANGTEYGLSAEIYTEDLDQGTRIAKELKSGTVAINTDNFFKPECPFGGYKKSGVGREYGEIGMQEFAQVKVIAVNKT